jgi:hypothetical protein
MRAYLLLVLCCGFTLCHAQKSVEQVSREKVDSLRKLHIDTLIWYHSYCGECFFKKTDAKVKYYTCQVQSGYDLSYNAIIYKQHGSYFLLNFDCSSPVIKSLLDTCNAADYFISIIPQLDERDKIIEQMKKNNEFSGPFQIDGFFSEADIYFNGKSQHADLSHMVESESNQSGIYKDYKKKLLQIDLEVNLFKILRADLKTIRSIQ